MRIKDIYKEVKNSVEEEMEKQKALENAQDAEILKEEDITNVDENSEENLGNEEENKEEMPEDSPELNEQRRRAQEALEELNNMAKALTLRVKNMKIFIILSVAAMVIACAFMSQRIINVQNQVEVLEAKLEENKDVEKEEAPLFTASSYTVNRQLSPDTTKNQLFNMMDEPYDVIFYNTRCHYCEELDKAIDKNQDKMPENLYFFNTKTASENSELIPGEMAGSKAEYETNEKDFDYPGTPTMVRFKDGKATVYVGADKIMEILNIK